MHLGTRDEGLQNTCTLDPGGGATWFESCSYVCVCPKLKELVLFRLQVNEMNENMSFKMSVKFAASLYMGKNFLDVWHVFIC